jgi:hypothetical protein
MEWELQIEKKEQDRETAWDRWKRQGYLVINIVVHATQLQQPVTPHSMNGAHGDCQVHRLHTHV